MFGYLKRDVDVSNKKIADTIEYQFKSRKTKLLNRNNLLASIGIPLKENANLTKTFSIPEPKLREQIRIARPQVEDNKFAPEPCIDEEIFHKILKIINDVGKNFESKPSTYINKKEEDLRDHILFVLDPHFIEGTATGETFNKRGKTDIMLRYESSVVFIAECKFWTGQKGYLEAISQLLSYLTWRDTKAAVIIFVKQNDISAIIDKIKIATKEHSNYLGHINQPDENWINYRFHINNDTNREVKLAIQIFHIPDSK